MTVERSHISSREGVERQVLGIAGALVNELGGTTTTPRLEHSLERDLGISSLERVELLLRLEQAFHIRLPDAVMAEAVTLSDVVTAVLRAAPRVAEPLPARREPPSPEPRRHPRRRRSSTFSTGMPSEHPIAYTSTFAKTTKRHPSGTASY